ncbi:hypothetical protein Tco_0073826 [Tanacetum coccineum]
MRYVPIIGVPSKNTRAVLKTICTHRRCPLQEHPGSNENHMYPSQWRRQRWWVGRGNGSGGGVVMMEMEDDDGGEGEVVKVIITAAEPRLGSRSGRSEIPDEFYGELAFFLGLQTTSTPIETNKALPKDEEAEDVDVHLYRSMIGSLMYLTASRPDIIYLKGQPKLGLWYPRDSPFDLKAFSDSDYAGASLDRKSTTGGCQFLGKRLISWQCKKQTIVANSTTEAEYVVAANCCGQVLWIQNQMLDYGFNFINTKIYIDNESTICIVKNPVFHSKTKHIEIRHHFTRDSYEKRLIQVIKIHTDHNVADLLSKAFDVSSDEFGVKTGSCNVNAARQDLMLLGEKGNADFHQIVDFLNASTIRYSLTISPTIYASYIEQFWATAKSKIVNNETQIHAKVDGKTIVISESSVRSNLHFNDEDGVTSLTNSEILENLALMGYEIVSDKLTFQKAFFSPQWKYLIHTILHCLSSKSTAWNEFSTNIASAVICLANNQKFNFSKLIFDEPFNDTYETPKHTQKVFANMRRKGKGFSGTSQVPRSHGGTIAQTRSERLPTPSYDSPILGGHTPGSDEERLEQYGLTDFVPPTPYDSPFSGGHTPRSDEGRPKINELMAICTNLSNRFLALETSKTAQDLVINNLKKKVKRLEKKQRARTPGMKLFKIGTSKRKSLDKENVSK